MSWQNMFTIGGILIAIILILAVVLLVFNPLLRRRRTPQQNNLAGGQPAAGATNQAAATTVTTTAGKEGVSWGKILLTLLLVVMILLGFTAWDHHYNDVDNDGWGEILSRIIDNPLLGVGAVIPFIGALWCSVHFLAEPSKWAKHVGAMIVIGLSLFGIFPMISLITGESWYPWDITANTSWDWLWLIAAAIAITWAFWPEKKGTGK